MVAAQYSSVPIGPWGCCTFRAIDTGPEESGGCAQRFWVASVAESVRAVSVGGALEQIQGYEQYSRVLLVDLHMALHRHSENFLWIFMIYELGIPILSNQYFMEF